MRIIKPPKLKKGDLVGLCCPSSTILHKQDLFARAQENFARKTGLKLVVAPHALGKHFYSSGTPEQRLADFHDLVADPTIKAIIFAAGGDTAIDLVASLDYQLITNNPKIIAGISDATTLLSAITAKTGLITFLGLEFLDFADHGMEFTLDSIHRAWFNGQMERLSPNESWCDLDDTYNAYEGWQVIQEGLAEGRLVGGNLQSFLQLVDTAYELDFSNNILFLESYRLPKKQIHKALMQLKIRGVLDKISGLIIGYCLECDNPTVIGNEQKIADTIREITHGYDFPAIQVGEIGHRVENFIQPLGAKARIDTAKMAFDILEAVSE